DHVYLPKLDAVAARHQIVASRIALERVIGEPVRSFSYPYGGSSSELQVAEEQAGYESATTTEAGFAAEDDDCFALPRVMVSGYLRLSEFLALIKGCDASSADTLDA